MNYDSRKLMTEQDVRDFFSSTDEFIVTDAGDSLKIAYNEDDKTASTLIWKQHITIQSLIRKIKQIVWNHCNNNLD